jgi:hypothetical protein
MNTFRFWQTWLFILSIFLIGFGFAMIFLGAAPSSLISSQVTTAFWGDRMPSVQASQFYAWAFGVWGSTLSGWGTTLAFLAHYPFRDQKPWAWTAVLVSLLVWYPVDTLLSWIYGVTFNVILNTVLFLLALVPVLMTRKFFKGS